VLVYGASGAVGTAAVQLAVRLGTRVTAVCSARNADLVTSLGASAVIDYTTERIGDRGDHYDVILDAVGKHKSAAWLRGSTAVLAPGGVIVPVDDGTPRFDRDDLLAVSDAAASGALSAVIDRVFPLDEIVDAHRYVDLGHKRGNVVVSVP